MRTLKAGVLLASEYPARRLVELARLIEDLGYDYLWYADQRFQRDCYSGLTAIALNTSRIAIGAGVNDPYSRHPALTAMSLATLDETSDGRAVLGLGTGNSGLRAMGVDQSKPVAALREAIELIRGLLRGETVECQGRVIQLAASRLSFSPRRAAVPVFIVTQGAQITRLAGALADGVLLANTAHAPVLRRMLGNLAAGAERAGRGLEELEIGLRLETCLSEDRASAMTLMKQRFVARLLARRETADLELLGLEPSEEFLQVWASEAADRAQRLAALLPDEAVSRSMLAGSTDEAVRSLAAALESEVGQVTIRPHAHAGQRVEDVITRFAEQVLPLARAARQ